MSFQKKNYYKNPVKNLKTEGFFNTFKNGCFDVEEIETTWETTETFITKNGRDLTELFLKKNWCNCLADFFEKSTEVSIIEFRINPLLCISLPGFIWSFVL